MLIRAGFGQRSSDAHGTPAVSTDQSQPNGHCVFCLEHENLSICGVGTREFKRELVTAVRAGVRLVKDNRLVIRPEQPGLLVVHDRSQHTLFAQGDILGLFPGYWTLTDEELLLSDNIPAITNVCAFDTDDVGVIEYMRFEYTIGQRTIFRHLCRLRPGEILAIDLVSGSVTLEDGSSLWAQENGISTDEAVEKGAELLREACRPMDRTMLMMSGGWDSRTLLAGALASSPKIDLLLYFHGDTESREASIVRDIAQQLDLQVRMRPIEATIIDPSFLRDSFRVFQNAVHPHWSRAGRYAAELTSDVDTICAGIFGEILGGHYGPPMVLSGPRKAFATLKYLVFGSQEARSTGQRPTDFTRARTYLHQSAYSIPWYVNAEHWRERFEGIHETVNADIEQAINRYISRGVDTPESVIEAFVTEQRGSQVVAYQLHTAAIRTPIVAPFCARSLAAFACEVPYSVKFNNTLNRGIIARLWPSLLDFPTAAILCRARRSILIQEFSRVMRKCLEEGSSRIHDITHGVVPSVRFGCVNDTHIQQSDLVECLINSFESPLWDKTRISSAVRAHGSTNYHTVLNMLLKMKTLDLFGVK